MWAVNAQVPSFLASAPDGGQWTALRRGRISTGRNTECTSWLGGSVVLTGGLNVLKKSFLHLSGKEPLFFSCLAGRLNTVSL